MSTVQDPSVFSFNEMAERDKAAVDKYRDTARRLADGKTVNEAETRAVCNDVGRLPFQLRQDVERLKTRQAAVKQLTEASKIEERAKIATEATAKAIESLEKVREKSLAMIEAAERSVSEASAKSSDLDSEAHSMRSSAMDQLQQTQDPSLQPEINRLESELRDLRQKIVREQNKAAGMKGYIDADESEKLKLTFATKPMLDQMNAKIEVHNAAVGKLEARIKELNKSKLDPMAMRWD